MIALVARKHQDVYQCVVNDAFLHGKLNEEVYMKMLEDPYNTVCWLKKFLYSLEQASQ